MAFFGSAANDNLDPLIGAMQAAAFVDDLAAQLPGDPGFRALTGLGGAMLPMNANGVILVPGADFNVDNVVTALNSFRRTGVTPPAANPKTFTEVQARPDQFGKVISLDTFSNEVRALGEEQVRSMYRTSGREMAKQGAETLLASRLTPATSPFNEGKTDGVTDIDGTDFIEAAANVHANLVALQNGIVANSGVRANTLWINYTEFASLQTNTSVIGHAGLVTAGVGGLNELQVLTYLRGLGFSQVNVMNDADPYGLDEFIVGTFQPSGMGLGGVTGLFVTGGSIPTDNMGIITAEWNAPEGRFELFYTSWFGDLVVIPRLGGRIANTDET